MSLFSNSPNRRVYRAVMCLSADPSVFILLDKIEVDQSKIFQVYYRSNKVQMRERRRKRNLWPVLTYQSQRIYLFILEPNHFCFCNKFFYKLVFDLLFLEYSILCVLRWLVLKYKSINSM